MRNYTILKKNKRIERLLTRPMRTNTLGKKTITNFINLLNLGHFKGKEIMKEYGTNKNLYSFETITNYFIPCGKYLYENIRFRKLLSTTK